MLTYARQNFNLKNEFEIWIKSSKGHILGWFLFISYEVLAVGTATGSFGELRFYLLHYSLNISLFYLHYKLILPMATERPSHLSLKVPILTALEVMLYISVNYLTDKMMITFSIDGSDREIIFNMRFISAGIWRSIYFIGFASALFYLTFYLKERVKSEKFKENELQSKLREKEQAIALSKIKSAYLRAQINPHFLFNTLSFIYSHIHKVDPIAANALTSLSSLMRYSLSSDTTTGFIYLKDEISQVESLINLWKMRQEHKPSRFILIVDANARELKFIPLVLLTLVENMIKHGELNTAEDPPKVIIGTADNKLFINTINLINTGLNDSDQHTGLLNISERLNQAYHGKVAFNYGQLGNDHFSVEISIPIEK